jgi:uncharacterized membrane protein
MADFSPCSRAKPALFPPQRISQTSENMRTLPLELASPLTQAHIACAAIAIVVGAVQFLRRKGTKGHKVLGWIWVAAIVVVAGTSFFMRDLNDGGFSPTHLFTAFTVIALPLGLMAARQGSILRHRAFMSALYLGGLVIAAFFTLTPGRLLHKVFFGG